MSLKEIEKDECGIKEFDATLRFCEYEYDFSIDILLDSVTLYNRKTREYIFSHMKLCDFLTKVDELFTKDKLEKLEKVNAD